MILHYFYIQCDQTQRKEETDVDIEEPVIEDIDDVVLNDVEQPVPEEISQTVSESINETIVSGTQELCTPKRLSADQLEDCHTPPNTNRPITDSVDDMISMETAAAKQLFSPGFRKSSQLARRPWTCPECHVINDVVTEDCDGCLETRPDNVSLEEAQPGNDDHFIISLIAYLYIPYIAIIFIYSLYHYNVYIFLISQ